ncbi:MAG: aldehyde dehydrogenase family protein [Acidimicrobiia bacterium]|nr:aldehyde dehydrogenase family protein [Acidimicrobiia bacterium]
MDADLRSIAQARAAVEDAHTAFQKFHGTDQESIDRIVEAMVRAIEPECARLGEMAAEETQHGNAQDKLYKNLFNALGVWEWLRNVRTVGILWKDDATNVMAIGEPMGVVAALIPVTNPTSTVIFKVLSAVKAGNAIVCAHHPRGVKSGGETARILAAAAEAAGAPQGLIQTLDEVTIEGTAELMRHRRTSVVMATGGTAMVRAAYSSGKPTLAVGPGNVPVYVDGTARAELPDIADAILTSKAFDYGTACVAEQAVIADRAIAGPLRNEMKLAGGYFCTPRESDALARVIFGEQLNYIAQNVGQPAARLAELAGFDVPPRTRVLLSDQTDVGRSVPLSAEKLNPVLAFYEVADSNAGYQRAEEILRFGGVGHTSALWANDPDVVAQFSHLPAGRILVNTPCLFGGMGYSVDIEPSFMLGTGTWSGSIVSDNVTALHLINIKRVAYESRPWRSLYDAFNPGANS